MLFQEEVRRLANSIFGTENFGELREMSCDGSSHRIGQLCVRLRGNFVFPSYIFIYCYLSCRQRFRRFLAGSNKSIAISSPGGLHSGTLFQETGVELSAISDNLYSNSTIATALRTIRS